ncbi:beta-glucosidase family protein [Hibiscus syriacus]|uniref:Pectinesterase n=1 Tax=Hibiscus syriacus TaxID=106335 RepID=A0A6A2X8C6_HIBSY|nr:beta-glucosidase family protein [Hibiscus syriacus]
MSAKIIITAVSIILLIGVAIGVVAVVQYKKSHEGSDLSPSMKAVSNFCSSTNHQDSCQKTLGSVDSTDPKEYIMKSILAAEDAVKKFFNYSDSLIVTVKNDSRTRMGLEDCKDMMDYAIQSLQASYSEVGDAQLHSMTDRVSDLRTWLSAVISYQQSCLDGFEDKDTMKKNMTDGITDASELTSNALAIVTKLTEILAKFGLQLNVPNSRKLLSVETHGYFPSWFSDVDRKLFAKIDNNNIKPNAIVAKDGSGQFRTIAAALAAAPKKSAVRHVIYVKAGIYDEYITLDKSLTNILMFGDGPRRTIVTGRKNFVDGPLSEPDSLPDQWVQNTAGAAKHQAVALRIQSDKSAFFNCRMDAYQDTLYNHANRQFFRNCVISGTIDFIFAQGKSDPNENTGIVIQNCRIVPEEKLFPDRLRLATYLGRPWKKFSTTVVMESTLGDLIRPEGWTPWAGSAFEDTLYYAEYNNRGPGANLDRRLTGKVITRSIGTPAMKFHTSTIPFES